MMQEGPRLLAAHRARLRRVRHFTVPTWWTLLRRAALEGQTKRIAPVGAERQRWEIGTSRSAHRLWQGSGRILPIRAATGIALVLSGAVAGLAAGQSMAARSAHRTGACIALNMAAALGYLDAQQQRQVRHALVTAINPDADLFTGGRPNLREACGAGADG
jgi:hypothetical protein